MSNAKNTAFGTVWDRFRFTVMSMGSGKKGQKYKKKLKQLNVQRDFDSALSAAHGKTAIDLGANVGEYTLRFAEVCQKVYAFEPDPWTADELRARVSHLPNVEVVEAAAATEDGELSIYRTPDFFDDPVKHSQSTSLVQDKINVDQEPAHMAKTIDFVRFLKGLQEPVHILKIDIEGAEVELLERLLGDPVCDRITHMFVETHETRIPTLAERTMRLREQVASRSGKTAINLDWK